jgi:purine catabolism regulator
MNLNDVLALPVLEGAHVVAGHAGLGREIRWVHISDLPDMLPWVQAEQLVLTTGYAWPRGEDEQRELVHALSELNLSGIALAVPHFFEHFSAAACQEADRVHLPLIEIPWDVPFARITEDAHRQILAEQYRVIERSEAIHRALTRAALESGSLQELTLALSKLIERTIAFADETGRILATATAPGQEDGGSEGAQERVLRFPEFFTHLENLGYLHILRTSSEPLHIESFPEFDFVECILCPIRLQEELVGLVWIIEGEHALNELDVRAAEHAAVVAALHIAHQRELTSIEARFGYTFLDSLLEGHFDPTHYSLERAQLLGFDPDASYRVGLLVINEAIPLSREGFLRREQTVEKLRQRLRFLGIVPLISATLNQIPFLLPESCAGERVWYALKADDVALAFGLPYAGVAGVQRSFREVQSIVSSLSMNQLYYYDVLLLPRVLGGDRDAQKTFIKALLGRLKQQRNGTVLIDTLLAWALSGFHANLVAEQMGIHPKTLKYRLTRASELGNIDLADADVRFRLQLCAHLMTLKDLDHHDL